MLEASYTAGKADQGEPLFAIASMEMLTSMTVITEYKYTPPQNATKRLRRRVCEGIQWCQVAEG